MAASPSAAGAEELALTIGSAAADAVFSAADLGEELPVVKPMFSALGSSDEMVGAVKSHGEEEEEEKLIALHERYVHT